MSRAYAGRRAPRGAVVVVLAGLLGVPAIAHPAVAASASPPQVSGAVPAPVSPGAHVADSTLLVGVDPGATLGDRVAIALAARPSPAVAGEARPVGRDVLAVPTAPGETHAKAVELRAQPHVRYVEPNYAIHADLTPNDPGYPSMYGLQAAHGIDAEAAWDTTTGSSSVVVGVLDTGIDYTHPDLAANVWSNPGGVGSASCAAGTHG